MQRYANFLIMNEVKSKGNGTKFELAGGSRVTRALPCQVQQISRGALGLKTPPPHFLRGGGITPYHREFKVHIFD